MLCQHFMDDSSSCYDNVREIHLFLALIITIKRLNMCVSCELKWPKNINTPAIFNPYSRINFWCPVREEVGEGEKERERSMEGKQLPPVHCDHESNPRSMYVSWAGT